MTSRCSLADSKELSDEMPLIHEDELQMQEFPLRSPHGVHSQVMGSQDEEESDGAIQDYIDQVAAKNLRSGHADNLPFPLHSNPSSPATLRSALKKVVSAVSGPLEEDKVLEDVVKGEDLENQKSYSQKELDEARKLLRLAVVEFYRGLGLLSNYRYKIS